MLHQRYKDICFLILAKATLPNYWLRRAMYSLRSPKPLHLHVGCGPKYLAGFVNIEINPLQKSDLWLDVRRGLPFRTGSVDSIYTTHMLEHFYPDELDDFLAESFRVLKPGCGIRIVVPSLGNAIRAFQQENRDWFISYPQEFESLGGKLSNYLFCAGQHRAAFDFSYLDEILRKTGFHEVIESSDGNSIIHPDAPIYEPESPGRSLFVEARKK